MGAVQSAFEDAGKAINDSVLKPLFGSGDLDGNNAGVFTPATTAVSQAVTQGQETSGNVFTDLVNGTKNIVSHPGDLTHAVGDKLIPEMNNQLHQLGGKLSGIPFVGGMVGSALNGVTDSITSGATVLNDLSTGNLDPYNEDIDNVKGELEDFRDNFRQRR